MKILILGAGGFLGRRLARELLSQGEIDGRKISMVTMVDITFPEGRPDLPGVSYHSTDFSDRGTMLRMLDDKPDLIFHLAAIVSGEAEKNFELGMKVNFHASLQLLELCRELQICPRIVFASSCAVFGGDVTKVIEDTTGPKPRSSYGTQKAMVDLLMNDYSRRNIVDARSLRLPTIAIRPGKPNAATSSFVSSIVREPLNGKRATYPVPDETVVWIQSPRSVIRNFIHAATLAKDILGDDRVINLPGLNVSIRDMINSLKKIAGDEVAQLIFYEADAFLQGIVLTWPPHFNPARAIALGFTNDASAEEIIRTYIDEEGIRLKTTRNE